MNVLFVIPPGGRALPTPPLGIGYLVAALINNGHICKILDFSVGFYGKTGSGYELWDITDDKVTQMADQILAAKADLVGFHVNVGNVYFTRWLISAVKIASPSTLIIIGGPHVTLSYPRLLNIQDVDIYCIGEGEQSLTHVVNKLSNDLDLTGVAGIIFRDSRGNLIKNSLPAQAEDLSALPFPAWDIFNLRQYLIQGNLILPAILSRGCRFQCSFCTVPNLCKFRHRSVDSFVDEIAYDYRNFKANIFRFNDSTFNFNEELTYRFCNELNSRGIDIKWGCYGRVEKLNASLLAAMQKAGCKYIYLGIESTNQRMLYLMRKRFSVERAKQIIAAAKCFGIKVICSFMIGFPGETRQTLQDTVNFILDVQPDGFYLFPFEARESTTIEPLVTAVRDESDRWWYSSNLAMLRDEYGRLLPRALLPWQHTNMFFRWEEVLTATDMIRDLIASKQPSYFTGEEELFEQVIKEFIS